MEKAGSGIIAFAVIHVVTSKGAVLLQASGSILAAVLYIAATVILLRSTHRSSPTWKNQVLALAGAGALVHAIVLTRGFAHFPLVQLDIVSILSLCTLVVVALWASSLRSPSGALETGLIALPFAALANFIDALADGAHVAGGEALTTAATGTLVHVVSSVIAFGLLSFAGAYAFLVLVIDHSLKRHELSKLVRRLPPLDQMEGLLFRLIATGFFVLSVSLVSGLIFVDDLLAQHLVHKTVFAVLAWLVFGMLLLGRWLWGWRGSRAVNLTLAGIALMLLSYFGSRLVLEVLLGRSWHS